ncbi:MAG: peptide deformylase [Bacteroides sp.]|nr:peptide deformylase [Bacteroides sp.]MCM1446934.1 peptide deformylase [Bacteroides sp.]
MILPIYTYGQPVLRKETEEIDPDYPQLQEIIQNMWETLAKSHGVGLAAPQVGLSIRLAIIDLDCISDDEPQYAGYKRVFINPYIEEVDDSEMETQEEGCLSLPGLSEKVSRPTRIHVTYQDENFQEHDEWVDGFLARVMQHEFDHLDGVVYTDRLKGLRRQLIAPKLKQLAKGLFRADYKVKPLHK